MRVCFLHIFFSIGLVVFLSLFPLMNKKGGEDNLAVFYTTENHLVTEEGIIAFFSNHPMKLELENIVWKEGVLFLHINSSSTGDSEEMYEELFAIFREFFVRKKNVKMIKCYVDGIQPPLLVKAKPSDILNDTEMIKVKGSYKQYINEKFTVE